MATALLTIEGVLAGSRTPEEPIVTSAPLQAGKALYEALSTVWRLSLITAESDRSTVEHFLAVEGLVKHALVAVRPSHVENDLVAATMHHLGQQRSEGTVGLVVTPSPSVAAQVMGAGVTALLFVPPNYARPEFRPDHERQPRQWDDIEAEITRQRALKARDSRLVV